ncbi:MAG TPA: polymer-forming cytoskeletal protein [Acidobacteriaceae bacterium]|nr:polymer-forming cytoskeletal protein [Acidobacteriaceae bacterium]
MNVADSSVAVIGKSVQIRGEVKGSEDLMVDGHVEGTITLSESRLTIGPNAHVSANVSARDVILLGHLNGNISATGRVELRDGCNLVGDISAARLSIEESAAFRGKVEPLNADKAAGGSPAKGAEVPVTTSPAKH